MEQKIVYVGLGQIAKACGCSPKIALLWIREKQFPAAKIDGKWRAVPQDVVEWLRERCRPCK